MSETAALIDALKRKLRAEGKTYADIAQLLGLSQASIKQMFSQCRMSLDRLEAICSWLDMELADLVALMQAQERTLTELTYQQEYEITQDLELVLVTVCVFNHWSIQDIHAQFTLSYELCIQKLLKLEKLGLIELLPHDRVRLRVHKRFKWLPNGPFEQFFRQQVGEEFFRTDFSGKTHCLHVLNASLSSQAIAELQQKIEALAKECSDANRQHAHIPVDERTGITLVAAMRSWDYGVFKHLVRQP
ncbi:MAG: transcriptional regulator [Rickettsiales bacterium]|nr:transcriptional regulator [Rickettsiales bacterium]